MSTVIDLRARASLGLGRLGHRLHPDRTPVVPEQPMPTRSSPTRPPQASTPPSPEPSATTEVHARSVLIVDDIAETRELVRWQLSRESELEVVGEAVDGGSAVSEAVRLRPDVVILDLMMPTQGGLQTIPMLRKALPHARVVAMTSYDSLDNRAEALELGATCYVVKGTRRAEFVRVVRHAAGLAT